MLKKDKLIYEFKEQVNAYKVYEEGLDVLERNDFFMQVKFSEAEEFKNLDLSAKVSYYVSIQFVWCQFL